MTTDRIAVPEALDGERVDRVVSFVTGLPRAEAAALVDAGAVALGGRRVTTKSKRVAVGDVLEIEMPAARPPPGAQPEVEVHVVFDDDAVIVVDKPAGLVVHPGAGNPSGTLVNGLLARFPGLDLAAWPDPTRPGIVHRLDKGTSGLLMVARTPEALVSLAAQLEVRSVERRYLALVWGRVEEPEGIVDAPVGRSSNDPTRMAVRADGRRAVTRYEVVTRWADPQPATLVRCTLDTGRTHQIRVHLTAIGHPIVGDERYVHAAHTGTSTSRRRQGATIAPGLRPGRPFLHAAVLGFDHPITAERLRFETDLPADLQRVLDALSCSRTDDPIPDDSPATGQGS